jgi:hypothetical protein
MDRPKSNPPERSATLGDGEPTLAGAHTSDGVDLTVIRWMLALSPTERLRAVQDVIDGSWLLRRPDET